MHSTREVLRLAIREVLEERDELQRDRDCLMRLYYAERPLHERRTMPSPAFPDDPEYQPPYMFQASFWTSGCRCVECHALHVGEQQYIRAEKAEAECERLRMTLKSVKQAFTEIHHASTRPDCFTHGQEGATKHRIEWEHRCIATIDAAMKDQP